MTEIQVSRTPNTLYSAREKFIGFLAFGNLAVLGFSAPLMIFVLLFATEPLSKMAFFDPLVLMSVSYLLAVIFGVLALFRRWWLVPVVLMYVIFFYGNSMDLERSKQDALVFCAELRADPDCAWSDREDAFVCEDNLTYSDMCPQYPEGEGAPLSNKGEVSRAQKATTSSSCGADWQLVWEEPSGMKAKICGNLFAVEEQGESIEGVLSPNDHMRLYAITERITQLPPPLISDLSVVNIFIDQGGYGYTLRFSQNELPLVVKELELEIKKVLETSRE